MGYTKLFTEIIMSTVWREPDHVRLLWITMLALKDRWHIVNASLPGLADSARITIEECEQALTVLSSPDPHSRTKDHDGRRIEPCDGGWLILNGEKYRNKMSLDERREYQRIKQREYRQKKKEVSTSCQQSSQQLTHTDTDTEAYTDTKDQKIGDISPTESRLSATPYQKIVDLYHETLPELPRVAKLTKTRKGYIQQRWKEDMPELKNWGNFFDYVKQSDFLTGKVNGSGDRPPFRADLEWLIKPSNFVKIAEGKYHV